MAENSNDAFKIPRLMHFDNSSVKEFVRLRESWLFSTKAHNKEVEAGKTTGDIIRIPTLVECVEHG